MKKSTILPALLLCCALAGCAERAEIHETAAAQQADIKSMTRAELGAELGQNYYAYVNFERFISDEIPYGKSYTTLDEDWTKKALEKELDAILNQRDTLPKGSNEQKIADAYLQYTDEDARNAAGIAALQPFLDQITAADTIETLVDVSAEIQWETGCGTILGLYITADSYDSDTVGMVLTQMALPIEAESLLTRYGAAEELQTAAENVLKKLGEENAEQRALAMTDMLLRIAERTASDSDLFYKTENYRKMSLSEVGELFPNADLGGFTDRLGNAGAENLTVTDPEHVKAVGESLCAENLTAWKDYLTLRLISYCGEFLPEEYVRPLAALGFAYAKPDEKTAREGILYEFRREMAYLFASEYADERVIQAARDFAEEIITAYREMISGSQKIDGETKAKFLKKFENMRINIDVPHAPYDGGYDWKSGGGFLENMLAKRGGEFRTELSGIGKTFDKTAFDWSGMMPQTYGNAQYVSANYVIIPYSCYVKTSGELEKTLAYIEEHNDFDAENLYDGIEESLQEMTLLFTGIFIVIALIILFVASGMSEHIVRERMAQLGTLRSIGAARSLTALLLISENLFYGLVGAAVGILLYIPLGEPMLSIFVSTNMEMNYGIHAGSVLITLAITSALACSSAVRAVLRAVKTPIRDIIFGSANTAYTLSKKKTVFGAALIAAGAACGFFSSNAIAVIAGVAMFTAGLALVMPALTAVICGLFDKCKKPVTRLAFKNIHTKKMVVGSVMLYAAVAGLVCAMTALAAETASSVTIDENAGDLIALTLSRKTDEYRFAAALDGVSETELVYKHTEQVRINGGEILFDVPVIGYDEPFSIYRGVNSLPERIEKGTVSLDRNLMKKYSISEGDPVTLTLNAKGRRPVTLTLTALGGCDSAAAGYGARNGIVLNLEDFKRVYYDYPETLLIRLEQPAEAHRITERLKTLMMDKYAMIYTAEEYASANGDDGVMAILYLISATGCVLMLILLSTNQSIGFEQRRRELAVLHSTAMSRAQLKKMLFFETAYSLLISSAAAFAAGEALYVMILRFVNLTAGIDADIPLHFVQPAVFLTLLYLAALLTVRGSAKELDKMNTAAQIKYE